MTDALYLDETDRRRFSATVERTLDDRLVLDRTAFYPEGGGQPADHGTLTDGDRTWTVSDVRKRDTIYHHVDGNDLPEPGTTVEGELDWDRRRAHMRYHTAQHLVSAVCLDEFDAPTEGNQLYTDRARIDVGYDRFSETDLADLEARVNDLVDSALPVEWYTMDRDAAEAELDPERTRIELLPDSITEVRIVEIGATRSAVDRSSGEGIDPRDEIVDRTACAGTHVPNTGEVGAIEVTGRETKGSRGERVHFELQ